MDWFEKLTGFRERDYHSTRDLLEHHEGRLHSLANGREFAVGRLELVSLRELRSRRAERPATGRLEFSLVQGDVRRMHAVDAHANALFQVASQFNLLEMVGPNVRPEDGVTRYQDDHTQGPACAIAAGAATIYRNYFAPVGGSQGQTADRQFDGLRDLGLKLSALTGLPVATLWTMRNGYALCTPEGLLAIDRALQAASPETLDDLRQALRIGLHWSVEVTDAGRSDLIVSQAFCSALPVAYCGIAHAPWRAFAQLVLEAAYEATLLAGIENMQAHGSNLVFLTRLGGGAFGNSEDWIDAAMLYALALFRVTPLDVRIVSFGPPPPRLDRLVKEYSGSAA